MRFICRNCGGKNYWKLSNGQYRCRVCKKDTGRYLTARIRLTNTEWIRLIDLFLIGANSPVISKQLTRNIRTVSKALKLLREIMTKDVPDIFEGTVEVDETYLGGQKKNKNKNQLRKERQIFGKESKRGFGTTKQPVFGILCRSGKVFAELVDDTEAKDLIPIITKKVRLGSKVCSDTYKSYTGLAAAGYVHRTVEHRLKEYVKGKNHINGLEGFWGFLKRKLASKGGVRRIYLPLFLGEYVWRYNHRKEELIDQRKRLIGLITDQFSARSYILPFYIFGNSSTIMNRIVNDPIHHYQVGILLLIVSYPLRKFLKPITLSAIGLGILLEEWPVFLNDLGLKTNALYHTKIDFIFVIGIVVIVYISLMLARKKRYD